MVLQLALETTQGLIYFSFCAAINLPICSLEYIKEIMPQGDVFHLCNVCEKLFLFYPLRRVKTWNWIQCYSQAGLGREGPGLASKSKLHYGDKMKETLPLFMQLNAIIIKKKFLHSCQVEKNLSLSVIPLYL